MIILEALICGNVEFVSNFQSPLTNTDWRVYLEMENKALILKKERLFQ